MQKPKRKPWRVLTLAIIVALLWVVAIGRLFFIQAIDGHSYLAKAENQQSRKFEIPATRGTIYIRENDGLFPIALNTQVYSVASDNKFVKDPAASAEKLSRVIRKDRSEIEKKLSTTARYVELEKGLNADEAAAIKDLELSGIILEQRPSRFYPEAGLFSHVLGYVNADGIGQYGFEQFANDRLAGQSGQLRTTTDSLGVPINSAENTLLDPKNGQDYVLTLDRSLQTVAANALKDAVQSNKAESGSIIVMDPNNGEIKALVNYPDYDPNNYRSVKDYAVFQNSSVSNLFEPGSGFKVITMAAGLDSGVVKPTTQYTDTGEVTASGHSIKNAENHKFGLQTMTDVIQKSLNTGMYFVLEMLGGDPKKITPAGKQALYNYIKAFGFGKVTGIEQAGEVASKVKEPTAYDIDYANMTFGQGISVTSIQLTAAVGAIANGGKLYRPHLVEGALQADGSISVEGNYLVNDKVISSESAAQLAQMMTQVVEHGSGWATKMKGYQIAGKTGTAQVPRADGKGYETTKNIGSFVGFAPADDPKFVMLVRIDYPRVEGFAEKTAVPAFAIVAKELMRYYNIAPQ